MAHSSATTDFVSYAPHWSSTASSAHKPPAVGMQIQAGSFTLVPHPHTQRFSVQTHNSNEMKCQCERERPTENQRRKDRQAGRGREKGRAEKRPRGSKEAMQQLPARVRGGKSSDRVRREERERERRWGNSTSHPSPVATVRANISLLVLAGGSQAVRERSGKLQRDRLTVKLSLNLIA